MKEEVERKGEGKEEEEEVREDEGGGIGRREG